MGGNLSISKMIGRSSVTAQFVHLQDGNSSGQLIPRTRENGMNLGLTTMLGQKVSLSLAGTMTKDKGEGNPDLFLPESDRTQSGVTGTLSENIGRFAFTQTVSTQRLRDAIDDLSDQTINQATLTAGGALNTFVNLSGVLSGTRSEGAPTIGTTQQYLLSLQPSFTLPKMYVALQPRAMYSDSKNDAAQSHSRSDQYQALVTWSPPWLGTLLSLQVSADWSRNRFSGQIENPGFTRRFAATMTFHRTVAHGAAADATMEGTAPAGTETQSGPTTQ
jgi:hypothetical protein